MTIYFPPNNNGEKRAILHTGDNFKKNLTFYAIFGWSDVDISGVTATINNDLQGIMHCNYGYDKTCNFASNEWNCHDTNSFCLNQFNRFVFFVHISFICCKIMINPPIFWSIFAHISQMLLH